MAKYRISPPAAQDLKEIRDYIAIDNPAAARKMAHALTSKFRFLAAHPYLFAPEPKFKNLCKHNVGNYLILYRPIKNGIEIARVLHGARDVEKILMSVN